MHGYDFLRIYNYQVIVKTSLVWYRYLNGKNDLHFQGFFESQNITSLRVTNLIVIVNIHSMLPT